MPKVRGQWSASPIATPDQLEDAREPDKNERITTRDARAGLASPDDKRRQAVLDELEAIAAGEITDVLSWDALGRVEFRDSSALEPRSRKAIKKVKVTPNQFGNQVEVEMHDKQAALRLLAKHHALLEPSGDQNRPSLIGINLKGPQVISYEVEDGDD